MNARMLAFASFALAVLGNRADAQILGANELKISFTDQKDAKAKATWSEPDKITITEAGLGWDGETNASRDSWIQTIPLAVGLSWRPAQSVHITAELKPEMKSITLPNGQSYTPGIGSMFVRYSPDAKHWSTWQAMTHPKPEGEILTNRRFIAFVNVPQRERTEYLSYMKEYQKMDVPWVSDEEALVKWILRKDPQFFSRSIPFVGYVQFLYEISLPGGQRITEYRARASFGVGGVHQPPKDKNVYKERDNRRWRFKAK